jgi:hypothetical protein
MSDGIVVLFHGTTESAAVLLLAQGWGGRSPVGANGGRPGFLYLTNVPENALWFAQEKGDDVVLEVRVSVSDLKVDPDDGMEQSVEAELAMAEGPHRLPGNVVLTKPLGPEAFSLHSFPDIPRL